MLRLFQGSFIFGEATPSHFFRVTTSTQVTLSQQLIFQSCCFFSFFRTVTFSQQLVFQNSFFFRGNILFFRISTSLWQLLFGTAIFSLFRVKITNFFSFFRKQVLLHSINFFRKVSFSKKLIFQKKQYSAISTFSGGLPF